jgi:hypothetical protein
MSKQIYEFTNIDEDWWWLVFLFIDDEGVQRLDEIGIRLRRWIGVCSPFTYCVTHECRLTSSSWKNDGLKKKERKKIISKRAFLSAKIFFSELYLQEWLPLIVYWDRLQSFHVIIVDNQLERNVEYEKYLSSLFQVIDEDYHHQMVMHPKRIIRSNFLF